MTVGTFQRLVFKDECLPKAFAYYQVYDLLDGVKFGSRPIIWLKKGDLGFQKYKVYDKN